MGAEPQDVLSGLRHEAALDGCVSGVVRPEPGILSKRGDGALVGVESAGEKAFRKSV